MPHVIEKTVFYFEELSDSAKESARQWYREGMDNFWSESVITDAVQIAEMLGIEVKTVTRNWHNITTKKSGTITEPAIWWSGFSSQGDGAQFEGHYKYKAKAHKAIRAHAPLDTELHAIADELMTVQKAHGYRLEASVKSSGSYSHEYCTNIDVQLVPRGERFDSSAVDSPGIAVQEEVIALLRRYMKWIYKALETEYEWQTADEQVDDSIIANGYEFTESGKRTC